MCYGLSMLFGCGLIFASGVVYGIMGIGKKYEYKCTLCHFVKLITTSDLLATYLFTQRRSLAKSIKMFAAASVQ